MNFTVYSKPGCPFCIKIKQVLEMKNLSYIEKVLDVDFNRNDFYDLFGEGSTFPQVLLGEQKLGGCTDSVKYLRENNII
jgi:glutaredoxin